MKVKSVKYNWHQNGSVVDRDGSGEDWERVQVGNSGCTEIIEQIPDNGMLLWNYLAKFEDGSAIRIFNPNLVEYFSE